MLSELRLGDDSVEFLQAYGQIDIQFRATTKVRLAALDQGIFEEESCLPYSKNYDDFVEVRPTRLRLNYDLRNWLVVTLSLNTTLVGGILLAPPGSDYRLFPEQLNEGVVVDLRVSPAFRAKGMGRKLMIRAIEIAKKDGWRSLLVETQDTNPMACKFYLQNGFRVKSITKGAYGPDNHEAMVIFELDLNPFQRA